MLVTKNLVMIYFYAGTYTNHMSLLVQSPLGFLKPKMEKVGDGEVDRQQQASPLLPAFDQLFLPQCRPAPSSEKRAPRTRHWQ